MDINAVIIVPILFPAKSFIKIKGSEIISITGIKGNIVIQSEVVPRSHGIGCWVRTGIGIDIIIEVLFVGTLFQFLVGCIRPSCGDCYSTGRQSRYQKNYKNTLPIVSLKCCFTALFYLRNTPHMHVLPYFIMSIVALRRRGARVNQTSTS